MGIVSKTVSPRSIPSIRPALRVTTSFPIEPLLNEPNAQKSDSRSIKDLPGTRSTNSGRSRWTGSYLSPGPAQLRFSSSAASDRDRRTAEEALNYRTDALSTEQHTLLPYYTVGHQRRPRLWRRVLCMSPRIWKSSSRKTLSQTDPRWCAFHFPCRWFRSELDVNSSWCEENPVLGPFMVIVLVGLLGAIYLPLHTACLLFVGAAVRPLPLAILVNVVAVNTNAQAGYFSGRYALRDRVRKLAEGYGGRNINVIRKAIENEGVKMVFMIRLVLHLTVCNAVLTITDVTHGQYSVGTLLGCIPGCAMLSYAGYIGRKSLLRDDAEPDEDEKLHLVLKIMMVCVAVAVFAYVTMVAKRAVRLHAGEEEEDGSLLDEPVNSANRIDRTDHEVIDIIPLSSETGQYADRFRVRDC